MANIKTKDSKPKTIKTLNKAVVGTKNLKDNIVSTKEKLKDNSNKNNNEENAIDYGSNAITGTSSITASTIATQFNKNGKKSFKETRENIIKSKIKIKEFKDKQKAKRLAKDTIKTGKSTIKNSKMAIKTSKDAVLKTQKMTKESVKVSKRAMQLAKETAKSTIKGIRMAIKATISAIKGIVISTKALVTAIMAGGWLAVSIILVVCLVAMLCSSIFGIFLSSEKTSANSLTMKEVVAECNQEFADRLQNIQDENPHDDYILDGTMASWKDVLLVYTIKESKGVNDQEVMTMNEEKKKTFKEIFWNMNNISSEVKTERVTEQGINTNELPKEVEKRVLHMADYVRNLT